MWTRLLEQNHGITERHRNHGAGAPHLAQQCVCGESHEEASVQTMGMKREERLSCRKWYKILHAASPGYRCFVAYYIYYISTRQEMATVNLFLISYSTLKL